MPLLLTPQLLSLSAIHTNRPRTTRRHAGFTTTGIDGRRLLAGVCNGHTIVEKIIHAVTVNIACGCNRTGFRGLAGSCIVRRRHYTDIAYTVVKPRDCYG